MKSYLLRRCMRLGGLMPIAGWKPLSSPLAILLGMSMSAQGFAAQVEIARKSFTGVRAAQVNELILPIVVNGAISEKLHYQTIFTLLNNSKEEIRTTLQVYGNDGKPGGVFCSPLAPPPSGASAALRPNAEYFQFTSTDLPFLNGWALVRWEGPASLLAGAEVTLVAAAPAPCLLICNHPSTEKLSSAQTPAVKSATEFRLPVTINQFRQTAVALINPSATETISIKITILDGSGDPPRLRLPTSFDEQVRPLQRTSKFLWQMAQEHSALTVIVPPPEMFQGSVILSSDAPFAAGAMNIMFPEGKFVTIPVVTPSP